MRHTILLPRGLVTILLLTAGKVLLLAQTNPAPLPGQLPNIRIRATLSGHDKSIVAISFSPDGEMLATGSEDGMVRLWSMPSGAELGTLSNTQKYESVKLFWSPSSKSLAVMSIPKRGERDTKIWDIHTRKVTQLLAENDYYLSWSANEQLILTANYERMARLWDARSGKLLATFEQDPPCPKKSFLKSIGTTDYCSNMTFVQAYFSPDDLGVITMSTNHAPKLWDVRTGRLRLALDAEVKTEWGSNPGAELISPDHSSIIRYVDKQLSLIDSQTGALKQALGDIGAPLAFSPDSQMVLTSVSEPKRLRDDIELRLYDIGTQKLQAVFERLPRGITEHYWSPDGHSIVIVGIRKTETRILDSAGHVRARLPYRGCTLDSLFGDGGCEPFIFSADGRTTLKLTNPLRLWSTETGELLGVVEAATPPALFSPRNPHILVTRGKDKTRAIVWEVSR